MAKLISAPTVIRAAGTKEKNIEEYIGRVNSSTEALSVARMVSPQGWAEPGQRPQFDEYSVVLKGCLCVQTETELHEVRAGQAFHCAPGEWVQYSSPYEGGAEYIAVCLPAFSPDSVNRDHA